MGASSCSASKLVAENKNYSRPAPQIAQKGRVIMLIVATDYESCQTGSSNVEVPVLSSMDDAAHMREFASACGVNDLTSVLGLDCTCANVKAKLAQVSGRCGPDDFFIFYFSGHGDLVADKDGDEADGEDSAYVLLQPDGSCHKPDSYFVDDDFCAILTKSLHKGARALILSDCCHSGSIADLGRLSWASAGLDRVISISGCRDPEEAIDTGHGGVLTGSMILAACILKRAGMEDCAVGKLFNTTVQVDAEVFDSEAEGQTLELQCVQSCDSDKMAWPLVPDDDYMAPFGHLMQIRTQTDAWCIRMGAR